MKYIIVLDNSNPPSGEKGAPIAGYTRSLGNGLHYSDEVREFTVKGLMREIKYIQKKDRITQDAKSCILKNVLFLQGGKNVPQVYRSCYEQAQHNFFVIDPNYPDMFYGALGFSVKDEVSQIFEHVNSIFANFSALDFAVFSIYHSKEYTHEININGQVVSVDKNWLDLKVNEKNINASAFGPNSLDVIGTKFLAIEDYLDGMDIASRFSYPFLKEKILLINENGIEFAGKKTLHANRFDEMIKTSMLRPFFKPENFKNPFLSKDPKQTNMKLGRIFDTYMEHLKKNFSKGVVEQVNFSKICNVRCGVIDKVVEFTSVNKSKLHGLRYIDNSDLIAKFVPSITNLTGCLVANSADIAACTDVRNSKRIKYSEAQLRLYTLDAILDYFIIKGMSAKAEILENDGCYIHFAK